MANCNSKMSNPSNRNNDMGRFKNDFKNWAEEVMQYHYTDFLEKVDSCEENLRETVVDLKAEYDQLGNKASKLLKRVNKIKAKIEQVDNLNNKLITFILVQ